MNHKILGTLFSLSGASIAIGVVGFMSGVVTIFVDVNFQLSVKWLLLLILLFVSFILVLLKVIYDLSQESMPAPFFEVPIKYVSEERVFVIKKNENFLNSIVVGCYSQKDGIDRLAYLGIVHLVQDKVIQIKIRHDFQVFKDIPKTPNDLKNIVVKPVVPVTALDQLSNMENSDV